nr:elongation of very long chain fatty acids protein 7-like [Leptinotarsa decemlineata]
MSSLMHAMVENYNEFVESRDPLVDSWLFMKSPIPVVSILLAYLYFVLKLGPQLMEKRKPYDLKKLMIFYNAYQVLFSLWLCSQALKVKKPVQLLSHTCKNPSTNKEFQEVLSNGAWWYFFSKIVELMDTVFFVLRKKQSQVTFLHVYHHACTMFFSWGYLKFLPGEQGVVIGFLNSLVHVVMYFYYFLAALGPKYQKYLWWKKYMTWIQLTQFCIMLAYLVFIIAMDCKLPKSLTFFFVANVVIFLYLFSDFYRKAYKKKMPVHKDLGDSNGVSNGIVKFKEH